MKKTHSQPKRFTPCSLVFLVFSILCVLYGFFIMNLKSGNHFYSVWFFFGVIFFFGFFVIYKGWWEKAPQALKIILRCIGSLALIWCVAMNILIFSAFNAYDEHASSKDAPLDYIIILGAHVYPWGPSPALKYRLDTAIQYLEKHPETDCIVSGGKGSNEHDPEAYVMFDYLLDAGIQEERIIIEDQSINTYENIEFSTQFFDPKEDSVGIVTNNFHIFRATAIAKKDGIAHVQGIDAPSRFLYLPNNNLREAFAITKDFFVGNI